MKKLLLIIPMILSACTTSPKVATMTQPATVIHTSNAERVVNKIADICDRYSLQIDNMATNSVTCSRQSSIMAQALLGTRHGTDVRTVFRFNAFQAGKGNVRVVANISMGSQTAFGQNNSTDLGVGGHIGQEAQNMLDTARKELEKK